MLFPACLVTELMIIPIPTSLPRSSSIDQCNSGCNFSASERADHYYGYLSESERAIEAVMYTGIRIIIS